MGALPPNPRAEGSAMHVTVNGEGREVPESTTVRGLIELYELTDGPVAVERNGEVVPRAEHVTTELTDGDVVEIVHFVGGG
jgi:sulfur carrier protein